MGGRGGYDISSYKYVGDGYGSYMIPEERIDPAAQDRQQAMVRKTYCQSCCIVSLVLVGLIALAVGAFRHHGSAIAAGTTSGQEGPQAAQSEGPPFDCQDGYERRASTWTLSKMYWCCDEHQLGCHSLEERGG